MIKFSLLKEIEPSLKLIFSETQDFVIQSISSSIKPKENTFFFVKNEKYFSEIGRLAKSSDFKKTGIVLEEKYYQELSQSEKISDLKNRFAWAATIENVSKAMCTLSKPFYDLMYEDLNYYVDGRQMGNAQVDPTAFIAQNTFIGCHVTIGKNVKIMPGVTILPEVKIGDDTIIFPNVTIYPYSQIGRNCRIHASTVIGADGFGYNFFNGVHHKIWHLAGVVIEDDVEIGGAAMIDAGAFIETRVGQGTKLDNFCQISHNAQIGKHCVFAGTAGSSGSGEVGDFCAFGAGAGLAPGARLGAGSQLAARTIVSENSLWPPKSILAGHPARPLKEWLKSQAKLRQLINK